MAGKLNPAGIGGLEIVLCGPFGFERLDETEIAALKDRSEALDLVVETSLFPRCVSDK
jgi:hypothetical protein